MKRSLFFGLLIFSVLFSAKAQQPSGTLVTSAIRPNDLSDNIATAFANEIRGGHHQVADTNARNAIFSSRRDTGMLCTVLDDGSGNPKTYQLIGGVSNLHWTEFSGASSSGNIISGAGLFFSGDTLHTYYDSAMWNAGKILGISIAGGTLDTNYMLAFDGNNWVYAAPPQLFPLDSNYMAGIGISIDTINRTISATNTQAIWNASQIQSRNISNMNPSAGQVLIWNNTSSEWIPAYVQTPLTAMQGLRLHNDTLIAYTDSAYWNASKLLGKSIAGGSLDTNYILTFDGNNWIYAAPPQLFPLDSNYMAGVGISIDTINRTISAANTQPIWNANQIQSYAVASVAPSQSQALMWNSTLSQWEPADVQKPIHAGNGLWLYNDTISARSDTALWNARFLMGKALTSGSPDSNYFLTFDGNNWVYTAPPQLFPLDSNYLAGIGISIDTTNKVISATNTQAIWNANKLQNYNVAATAPNSGQFLRWNSNTGNWEPTDFTAGNTLHEGLGISLSGDTVSLVEYTIDSLVTNNVNNNYIPYKNGNEFQSSNIYFNGNKIGIGTSNPGIYDVNIAGNVNIEVNDTTSLNDYEPNRINSHITHTNPNGQTSGLYMTTTGANTNTAKVRGLLTETYGPGSDVMGISSSAFYTGTNFTPGLSMPVISGVTAFGRQSGATGDTAIATRSFGVWAAGADLNRGNNYGVLGVAGKAQTSNIGVLGAADNDLDMTFQTNLYNISAGKAGIGIYGYNPNSDGYAGYFNGNMRLTGAFNDMYDSSGMNGQVLKSTGSGTIWSDYHYAGQGITLQNDTIIAQLDSAFWNANRIQGYNVSAGTPDTNYIMIFDGTTWTFTSPPQLFPLDSHYTAGTGIVLDTVNKTISATSSQPIWNANQIQNRPVSSSAPAAGQILKWNGASWVPADDENTTYTGSSTISVSGNSISAYNTNNLWNANQIQSADVSAALPTTDGQILAWNAFSSEWEPRTPHNYKAGMGLNLINDTFHAQNANPIWSAGKIVHTDIDTNSPAAGQYLKFNGTKWTFDSASFSDSFNANRTITRTGLPGSGSNLNKQTLSEFIEAYFFPTQPPLCSINGSGSTTLEYKSTANPAITVNLNFSVNRQGSTEELSTAVLNTNQSITGFPYNFFTAPGTNNQSGSLSGVSLIDNVTNTFTVTGNTTDGKDCSSSISYVFSHKRYWGAYTSAVPPGNPAFTISDAQIIALGGAGVGSGNEFATSRIKSYDGIDGGGDYLVFAFPSAWGNPQFIINGLSNTAFTRVRNNAFINASGYSETYQVWVSNTQYISPVQDFEIQ
jgi:hypothetical protein